MPSLLCMCQIQQLEDWGPEYGPEHKRDCLCMCGMTHTCKSGCAESNRVSDPIWLLCDPNCEAPSNILNVGEL